VQAEVNLAYYGIYMLAAAHVPGLQPLLMRLFRCNNDRVESLLGEYVDDVAQLFDGAFDGDSQALFDLLGDVRIYDMVRWVAFGAVARLTWAGRIPVETTRAFVDHFETSRLIPESDYGWNGWESAIELLGWEEFAPRVEAAYADGRLDNGVSELGYFREGLAAAIEAAPDDDSRFTKEGYRAIGDVFEVLAYPAPDLAEEAARLAEVAAAEAKRASMVRSPQVAPPTAPSLFSQQRKNPLRHVGRNDPCPCGSGKKYKKCCLAA
jgi:hypothetical protein